MANEPGLYLSSRGLLSKWGFNDGDEPDEYLDWLDNNGHPHLGNWHAVLRKLVREHLLPLIKEDVEVYDIETIHNPIRASTVNGAEVNDYSLSYSELRDVGVVVPFAVVLETQQAAEHG